MRIPPKLGSRLGFSLVELMVVICLIILLAGFSTSALRGLAQGSRLDCALIGISGALETARQVAISSGTYTWVGMNSSNNDLTKTETITVATFASGDGTKGEGAKASQMKLLARVERFDGVKLEKDIPSGNNLSRAGQLPQISQVVYPNDSDFKPKSDELPTASRNLDYDWVVIFTPRGEACIDNSTPKSGTVGASADDLTLAGAIRMVVVPCKGASPSQIEGKTAGVIQINGLTGQVDVFKPQAQ